MRGFGKLTGTITFLTSMHLLQAWARIWATKSYRNYFQMLSFALKNRRSLKDFRGVNRNFIRVEKSDKGAQECQLRRSKEMAYLNSVFVHFPCGILPRAPYVSFSVKWTFAAKTTSPFPMVSWFLDACIWSIARVSLEDWPTLVMVLMLNESCIRQRNLRLSSNREPILSFSKSWMRDFLKGESIHDLDIIPLFKFLWTFEKCQSPLSIDHAPTPNGASASSRPLRSTHTSLLLLCCSSLTTTILIRLSQMLLRNGSTNCS